jgi:hypothetical protein
MIDRYNPCYYDKSMDLEDDGEYVRYEDYKRLKSELQKWQNLNIENLTEARQQYLDNKKSLACTSVYIIGLEQALQHYKEALKECVPIKIEVYMDIEGSCPFCYEPLFMPESKHKDDCEYIKLTESKDE